MGCLLKLENHCCVYVLYMFYKQYIVYHVTIFYNTFHQCHTLPFTESMYFTHNLWILSVFEVTWKIASLRGLTLRGFSSFKRKRVWNYLQSESFKTWQQNSLDSHTRKILWHKAWFITPNFCQLRHVNYYRPEHLNFKKRPHNQWRPLITSLKQIHFKISSLICHMHFTMLAIFKELLIPFYNSWEKKIKKKNAMYVGLQLLTGQWTKLINIILLLNYCDFSKCLSLQLCVLIYMSHINDIHATIFWNLQWIQSFPKLNVLLISSIKAKCL